MTKRLILGSIEGMSAKHHKNTSGEPGCFGQLIRLLILCGLIYAVYYMVANDPPDGNLVCDRSARINSLTQFGTCHKE